MHFVLTSFGFECLNVCSVREEDKLSFRCEISGMIVVGLAFFWFFTGQGRISFIEYSSDNKIFIFLHRDVLAFHIASDNSDLFLNIYSFVEVLTYEIGAK